MTTQPITADQLTTGATIAANGGTLNSSTDQLITRWGTVTRCEQMDNGWWDIYVDFGDRWPSHVNVPAARTFVTRNQNV